MRVLFTAYDGVSHLFAMVPLAQGLRAAGHEVLVATAPAFTAGVARTGLPAVAAGHDVDRGAAWHGFDLAGEFGGRDVGAERTLRAQGAARRAVCDVVHSLEELAGVARNPA